MLAHEKHVVRLRDASIQPSTGLPPQPLYQVPNPQRLLVILWRPLLGITTCIRRHFIFHPNLQCFGFNYFIDGDAVWQTHQSVVNASSVLQMSSETHRTPTLALSENITKFKKTLTLLFQMAPMHAKSQTKRPLGFSLCMHRPNHTDFHLCQLWGIGDLWSVSHNHSLMTNQY